MSNTRDENYSHRTQISLSPSMYKRLMREKGDKSLAGHIRTLIRKSWITTEEVSLDDVINKLSEPMDQKPPSTKEVIKWQKDMREDRALIGR